MQRILITDAIRAYANKYKEVVEGECPNVKHELTLLREGIMDYSDSDDKEAVVGYLDQLICDYPKVLTLEPKDWNFDNYRTFTNKFPKMLQGNYDKDGKPEKSSNWNKLYNRIIGCMHYEDVRRIIGKIFDEMEIRACVYCNVSPAVSDPSGKPFYELDHFMPKSQFPFLCTCFYNLIPCDSDCNKRKNTGSSDFQLFINDADAELNPFKFATQTDILDNTGNKHIVCNKIEFLDQSGKYSEGVKNYNKMFEISSKYSSSSSKKVVENIWGIVDKYGTMGQVENYRKSLCSKLTRDEIYKLCLGLSYNNKSPIHVESWRKLKIDTLHQLEEDGLLGSVSKSASEGK